MLVGKLVILLEDREGSFLGGSRPEESFDKRRVKKKQKPSTN